jgi:antitoxin component of MazEF toxin-antitoxin module
MRDVRKPYPSGDSIVMSLSEEMREALRLDENSHVDVEIKDDRLVLRPLQVPGLETNG